MRLFWSYAKSDNKKPQKLTTLREALSVALDQTTGAKNHIIFDEIDLPWGAPWKQTIEELIGSSECMICILTPSYFSSRMCIHEFMRATELGLKIYPLYYREAKNGLKSSFKEDANEENVQLNKASLKIRDIQYRDFRKFKNKDVYCEQVQDILDQWANEIA